MGHLEGQETLLFSTGGGGWGTCALRDWAVMIVSPRAIRGDNYFSTWGRVGIGKYFSALEEWRGESFAKSRAA